MNSVQSTVPDNNAEGAPPRIAIIGNPNVGKSTIFNRLTGASVKVGNYPGVTVERSVGRLDIGGTEALSLIDVPGTYSLSARSAEEQIAIQEALGLGDFPAPDLVLVVLDAGQLTRNLYLAVQLAELRAPMVVALNMVDEALEAPSPEAVSQLLGVPCVGTNARSGSGLDELRDALRAAVEHPPRPTTEVRYPAKLMAVIDRLVAALPEAWRGSVERDRGLALWTLLSVDKNDELENIPSTLRRASLNAYTELEPVLDVDEVVIETRYRYIEEQLLAGRSSSKTEIKRPFSERIDRIALHPLFGFALFVAVMLLLFQTLFAWSDPLIGAVENGIAALQGLASSTLPSGIFRDLITEGVSGGVGNVVVFLPQIVLLFFLLGLLEDCGYMSRIAYLMDRIMRSCGLHGRAFVPMFSGFACAVPAILATRTMERQRDRLLTMMVVPLMSCSARLPVYTLIIAALFPPASVYGISIQSWLMVGMYLFSTATALVAAAVLGRTAVKGRHVPLLMELPPYRTPDLWSTVHMVWQRSRSFLKEAGTVILACTILLWALLSFPKPAPIALDAASAKSNTEMSQPSALEQSYAGQLGKTLEPAIEPLGFDWKIGVGWIGAFAAREVFVSTMGLVYGIGDEDVESPLRERLRAESTADGKPRYTPLVGLSLMIFFALACQCMSTLAVVKRETRTWRWPAFMFAYMTALAWVCSFVVYQGGVWLGYG